MKHERYYYTKRNNRKRKLAGLCIRCGEEKESKMWQCQACRDELKVKRQEKRQALLDLWRTLE